MGPEATRGNHSSSRLCRLAALGFVLLLLCFSSAAIAWAVHRSQCTEQAVRSGNNLHELGGALFVYAQRHSGSYPDRLSDLFLDDPDLDPKLFITPWGSATPVKGNTPAERAAAMATGGHSSYGYLGAGANEMIISADTILMYEADGCNPIGKVCCLFGDRHIEVLGPADAINQIVNTLRKGKRNEGGQRTGQP